ncbi:MULTISPECIES: hypothetical protein [Chryseobacterium]|uniref:SnoaL-like domain-containing protein n=1 Tax=Chryseobacterium geocarposphaerae TaxID=1416776 RepID=A0ABU1LGM6_9FLAO|nr:MULTISPECIES: hypothetical protein [Chryseobacterium]MDR6405867.1 hypothetical protein [Chryseobacterium geocarposphaerae]MDR6698969.1 hypothetical protein [Chryseobacterium ginsenosidimutans]
MVGNFKLYFCFWIFLFSLSVISCNKQDTSSEIGEKIINKNINIFIDDLHWSTVEKNKNFTIPIFISNHVTDNKLFLEECDCFYIFNSEGFNVDSKSTYVSFFINTVPLKVENKNIKFVKENTNIDLEKYVEISFNNFYINKNQTKAFLIVEKIGHGIRSWTKEVYFFKKVDDNWKFYKKELLLIG